MTLNSSVVDLVYVGNGSSTEFSVTFSYFEDSDISVYTKDTSVDPATETLLTQVTGAPSAGEYRIKDQVTSDHLITSATVETGDTFSSDIKIYIRRGSSSLQGLDYINGNSFPPQDNESGLDRAMAKIQEIEEILTRVPKLAKTSDTVDLTFGSTDSGLALTFSADGEQINASAVLDTGQEVRAGEQTLTVSTTEQAVVFSTALGAIPSITATLVNEVDGSPIFQPVMITAASATGFTAKWNSALATGNYKLHYIAVERV